MNRVGFPKRLIAALVDGAIIGVVWMICWWMLPNPNNAILDNAVQGLSHLELPGEVAHNRVLRQQDLVVSIAILAYGLLEIAMAATVGKTILQLKITAPEGSPAPLPALALRYAIKYAPAVVVLVVALAMDEPPSWLGPILALIIPVEFLMTLGAPKLALYDTLSKTAVGGGGLAIP